MKTFQTLLLGIFGFFIVAGVIVIASFGKFGGQSGEEVPPRATIWGTLEAEFVNDVITYYNQEHNSVLEVTYREIPEDLFDRELIEALAAQRGPDVIILPHEFITRYEDKIFTIPYESLPERLYRDTYAEGTEVYLSDAGTLALPVLIDPLVLYWNRTLFNEAGIAKPPAVWEELLTFSGALTTTDTSFNVLQSTIALGGFDNVANAKEVIATLVMQAGNPIVTRAAEGRKNVLLSDRLDFAEPPADSAVRFYTEFANPTKPVYAWNSALPLSTDMFLRGDLALYLGFASELFKLQERNPNLNFDVARVPQVRDGVIKATFGNFYGLAILRQSDDIAGAYSAISILTSAPAATLWAQYFSLPPARRDLLSQVPTDAFRSAFFAESLIAQAFLDPAPAESTTIFREMIGDITSGRRPVSQAVSDADTRLQALFDK